MAASQAELQKQLDTINARLAAIQARLDRATRGTPQTKELSRQKRKLEEEKNKVTQQLNNLTTTTPPTTRSISPASSNSQDSLKKQLDDIDKTIAEKNAELIKAQAERNGVKQQLLNSEIEKLKRQRARVVQQLNNLNTDTTAPLPNVTVPPYLNRGEIPNQNVPTNQGLEKETRSQQTTRENFNVEINNDWRVRLYLAPESNYLYKDPNNEILSPLKETNGVIFPYTPQIQVTHTAKYDEQDVTHSNYKLYFYRNSTVEGIQIMGEFTAQDTTEANYLLAVIHFFKSVTKMFYGKDQNPVNGSPPPICYLDGFGTYQFNKHPLLITNFSYTLPIDVDYIRATINPTVPSGLPNTTLQNQGKNTEGSLTSANRLNSNQINPGGVPPNPQWIKQENRVPTYVPTKMQITINAIPVISRRDISNNFSLQAYANGSLLLGKSNTNIGAGIW
jgi:hypothetical protein